MQQKRQNLDENFQKTTIITFLKTFAKLIGTAGEYFHYFWKQPTAKKCSPNYFICDTKYQKDCTTRSKQNIEGTFLVVVLVFFDDTTVSGFKLSGVKHSDFRGRPRPRFTGVSTLVFISTEFGNCLLISEWRRFGGADLFTNAFSPRCCVFLTLTHKHNNIITNNIKNYLKDR